MKSYSVTTHIRATPEAVWALLTDAAQHPEWNAELSRVDGRFAMDETVAFHRKVSPPLITLKVTAFEPARRLMLTGGGMPHAIFKGERIYTLSPRDGGVEVTQQLTFSGLMAAVITKAVPDQQPTLEQAAAGLKRLAEQA